MPLKYDIGKKTIKHFEFKGALTLKIDQDYFKNNIIDDGSYTLVGSESIYTKTIPANLLSFSMDDDCKLHIKFKYQNK